MTPAETVILEFGGVRPLARLLDIDPAAVSRWKRSGYVPHIYYNEMLAMAKKQKIRLTCEDLVLGR